MIIAAEIGLLYAVMALGVYLTFRILDFPDLTVDGSFTAGGAVAAVIITAGISPLVGTLAAILIGIVAGVVTGLLHTKGGISPLLAGILTQIALYSVNLRIMGLTMGLPGRGNVPLLRAPSVFDPMKTLIGTWGAVAVFAAFIALLLAGVLWFLGTELGLSLRATGDNELMAASQGINTDRAKVLGLAISNGMVAGCGALVAQFQGFADISMGIGLIVAGLASVIIGQALIGRSTVVVAATAVVLGSLVYRGVIQLALSVNLNPNDMKLISAVLVVLALLLPRWAPVQQIRARRREARERKLLAEEVAA